MQTKECNRIFYSIVCTFELAFKSFKEFKGASFWIYELVSRKGWLRPFFYDDNFRVLKDIKSYFENYNFEIHSKFTMFNKMHWTNPKFPMNKVKIPLNSIKASYVPMSFILTNRFYVTYFLKQGASYNS
jgi:hypothetical protein